MIKNFKKITLGLLTTVLISSSTIVPAFAADNTQTFKFDNKQTSFSKNTSGDLKLPSGPASFQHKTKQASLDKNDLWELKSLAEDANDQNTNANYVSLASFILALVGYGDASTLSSAASYAMQSHLDAFGTLDYAFTEYKNLDDNPELGSIPTIIPLERFYDGGEYMSDWYPCDAPYEAD